MDWDCQRLRYNLTCDIGQVAVLDLSALPLLRGPDGRVC